MASSQENARAAVDSVAERGTSTAQTEPSVSTTPQVSGQDPTTAAADASKSTADDGPSTKERADTLVAEGKKAIALKQWEEGVNKYAEALDLMRSLVGDQDPAMAPLLLSYGKALFELAFSQAGVMGKEEVEREMQREDSEAGPSNLVESADPELLADAGDEEGDAAAEEGDEANGEGPSGAAEADDEPEDDYNAAWEVVDVARTIYLRVVEDAKQSGKDKEAIKEAELRLAECYETLGDISCETENFSQAASDYTSSLSLLSPYHAPSSRILATLHFQLGVALEFLPQRRSDALSHVESALAAFRARLAELDKPSEQMTNPDLAKLSPKDREAEKKEVGELIGDLEVKVEELKSAPEGEGLVEEGIRHLVGGTSENALASGSGSGLGSASAAAKKDDGPVNDLSGMVKKKKKPVVAPAAVPVNGSGSTATNGTDSAPAPASAVNTISAEATGVAKDIKEAVVHAAEKAAEIVEAKVLGSEGATANGSAKRDAPSQEQDEDRASKRAKAE